MYETPTGVEVDIEAPSTWVKLACLHCEFTAHQEYVENRRRCPNDGSLLLVVEGTIVADDIITVARLLAKSDREAREASRFAVAARADLSRVGDIVNRRRTDLLNITR